jgi:hypothetical protein
MVRNSGATPIYGEELRYMVSCSGVCLRRK